MIFNWKYYEKCSFLSPNPDPLNQKRLDGGIHNPVTLAEVLQQESGSLTLPTIDSFNFSPFTSIPIVD